MKDVDATDPDRFARSHDQMRLLAEVAQDLNSSLKLEEVFEKIAARVCRVVDSNLFFVLIWDERKQALQHIFTLKNGRHVEITDSIPAGTGITGTVARLRRPVRVGDVTADPRYVRFTHSDLDIRSELAVPLICQDQLVGVLDLESTEPDLFTEDHEQMLMALGSHMATALVNARLYEKMLEQERRMERELGTARRIQLGLLPEEAPLVPGLDIGMAFAPARELAGDFYDFLPYVDGRMGLAVGDVAGKGTGAALYGALAVGIMRGHVVEHSFSPAEMLSHLNDHLNRVRADTRFLAMAYGLIEPQARVLTLATAGVPWPRLVRGGKIEALEIGGLPLGLFPDAEYRDVRIELEPGDVVVLCSDGLEDCLYEKGGAVPEPSLDAWVRKLAARPARAIAEELIRVSDPVMEDRKEAADDRTVVVVKVPPA